MFRIKQWMMVTLLSVLYVLPSYGAQAPVPIKNLLVFGDSLSDTNGPYSTWRLLNTLRGTPMLNLEPFVVAAMDEDIPGFKQLDTWRWFRKHLDNATDDALKVMVDITKHMPIPLVPNPDFYLTGMFSGGTDYKGIWPDYLHRMLGATLDNRAMTGSWTLCANQKIDHISELAHIAHSPEGFVMELVSGNLLPPCEGLIIDAWENENNAFKPDETLVVFFTSANDYLNGWTDTQEVVNKYLHDIKRLIHKGAKHMLVINQPSINLSPRYRARGPEAQAKMAAIITKHNAELADGISSLRHLHPDVKLTEFDAPNMLSVLQTGAALEGINTVDSCLNETSGLNNSVPMTACNNPDQHFFFDTVHPTAHTHYQLALYMCQQLSEVGYRCDQSVTQPLVDAASSAEAWFTLGAPASNALGQSVSI